METKTIVINICRWKEFHSIITNNSCNEVYKCYNRWNLRWSQIFWIKMVQLVNRVLTIMITKRDRVKWRLTSRKFQEKYHFYEKKLVSFTLLTNARVVSDVYECKSVEAAATGSLATVDKKPAVPNAARGRVDVKAELIPLFFCFINVPWKLIFYTKSRIIAQRL